MGPVNNDAMVSAYVAIARRAWATNRGRADELERLVEGWRSSGGLFAAERGRLRELAHSLHGSAGTFGHPEVAAAAAALEGVLMADASPPIDDVSRLVAQIALGLADPPTA